MPIPLRWYCAELIRHHEADAFNHLRRTGFESFIPLTPVERRHARKTRIVDVPMLPGYGFVRFDTKRPGWQKVWRTPYVKTIIGQAPERPSPVPDQIVRALQTLRRGEDPRKAIASMLIPEGATVAIMDGAWSDHRGVCILSDEKRARIAIELFGRTTFLDIDPTKLRIVSLEGANA